MPSVTLARGIQIDHSPNVAVRPGPPVAGASGARSARGRAAARAAEPVDLTAHLLQGLSGQGLEPAGEATAVAAPVTAPSQRPAARGGRRARAARAMPAS